MTQFGILSVKLFLYVHYFYLPSWADRKKRGILKAYQVAQEYIALSSIAHECSGLFSHTTGTMFRNLFTAACVLWKVHHSSYHVNVDFGAGRASFNCAVRTLRDCSVENNDIAARHSEILLHLWKVAEIEQHRSIMGDPTVSYSARHGASLSYDCLFCWRDIIGGQVTNGLDTSPTSESTLADPPPSEMGETDTIPVPVDGVRHNGAALLHIPQVPLDAQVLANESEGRTGIDVTNADWDFNASALLFPGL